MSLALAQVTQLLVCYRELKVVCVPSCRHFVDAVTGASLASDSHPLSNRLGRKDIEIQAKYGSVHCGTRDVKLQVNGCPLQARPMTPVPQESRTSIAMGKGCLLSR